jgi:AcrR family transcriptional regulator
VADPKLTPRKAPRQDRAKATVEAILIAGERLTRRDSLDAWTTNHVADLAGVSIGSLYQYFPSKPSLVVAIYLHRREPYAERLAAALVAVARAASPDDVAAAIARAWLDDGAPAIDWGFDLGRRAHLLASGAARKLAASDLQLAGVLARLLERRGWATPATAPARGALVVDAVERLLAPAIVADPRWSSEPALRAVVVATLAALLRPAGM